MVNCKDDLALIEQTKEQQQSNWLLSNLLPQSRSDTTSTTDNSPVRTRDETRSPLSLQNNYDSIANAATAPNSSVADGWQSKISSPQQKSLNLLPDVPVQHNRKLSEREQRDCEVIGNVVFLFKIVVTNFFILHYSF